MLSILLQMSKEHLNHQINFPLQIMKKTIIILYANLLPSSISLLYIFLLCSPNVFCAPRDTLKHGEWIFDNGSTLLSPGGMFELGFFTPTKTSSPKRFVGIWYHKWDQQVVVWVANRNDPILSRSTGTFGIAEDGNLKVLDNSNNEYWSTTVKKSLSANHIVKLMDSGNLVLSDDDDQLAMSLWESFKNPTDTFLLGMKMGESIKLVSWTDSGEPRSGNFTFKQDELEGEDHYIITNIQDSHWQIRLSSDEMPNDITCLLSNFSRFNCSSHNVNKSRLVIDYRGRLRYLKWDLVKKSWTLVWWEPEDQCKIYNACGKFGSCNIDNKVVCKCLPGFKPRKPERWQAGDFFDGCTRNSILCDKNDTFLNLEMMKVPTTNSQIGVQNEEECRNSCLKECQCQAYSYEAVENSTLGGDTTTSTSLCLTWNDDLINLQDEYANGGNLSVRVAKLDTGDNAPPLQWASRKKKKKVVPYVVVSSVVTCLTAILLVLISKCIGR